MTRETRFRISGLLFYALFILNLFATRIGQCFLDKLSSQSEQADIYQAVIALVGVGALLFTSDVIGYILSTVCYVFWSNNPLAIFKGEVGYAAEMEKELGYNLKNIITKLYKNSQETDDSETLHKKFEGQWETYSPDVFFSYIFQQAPPSIAGWTSRRHTAFFAGIAATWAIVVGIILSIGAICFFKMGWTSVNTFLLILSIILLKILHRNAQQARKEAWQMIDLWIARALNPNLRTILRRMEKTSNTEETQM